MAKGDDWTILQLDRKRLETETLSKDAHVAGGAHKGLVVNRQLSNGTFCLFLLTMSASHVENCFSAMPEIETDWIFKGF